MATDMLTSLANQFGGPIVADLGTRLGLPASAVKAATPMVIGLVLSGARRLAAQPGGKEQLGSLLQSTSDRMGTRDLDGFVKEADPAKSADLLNALTGGNSVDQVAANLAGKTGMDPHAVGKMLGIMGPAVLGSVAGMAKEQDMDIDGIVGALDSANLGGLGDMDYLLDNVPGVSDDIKRGFDKLFGR